MAKTKRANHRSGADKPRWAANGTVDGSGPPEPGREADRQQPNGVNGHSPNGQVANGPVAVDATATGGSTGSDFGAPVRLDEIAVAAMALSDGLVAVTRGLPDSVESRRFRRDLDQAASTFRAVAGELESTAGGLVRLAAGAGQACAVTWGICPEHGLSLMAVGEVATCRVLGCDQQPEGQAPACDRRVAYRVVNAAGPAMMACSGHAVACRIHLQHAVITLASDSLELL